MIPLRKAAIYALGQLGGPEDMERLKTMAETNPALTAATRPALRRLSSEQ